MASTDDTNRTADTAAQLVLLVNRAKDGNRSAFAQLVDQFHSDVFRMVFYRIRSRTDAEDIAQDVFLKAFQKISTVKDAARFRGWLFSIALNRIRDFQRKKRFRSLFKVEEENIAGYHISTLCLLLSPWQQAKGIGSIGSNRSIVTRISMLIAS